MKLADDLYAVNTNPAAALEEYGLMVLRFKRVYKLVFENRITRHFLRAIPGLDDYSIIGKAWWHTTEEKQGQPVWDTLVFDLPASGPCLSMLRIAWVILETVPEGPLTRDARSLVELLLDRRRTALVLVTLAEDMPTNEARDLTAALNKRLGVKVAHLFVNQDRAEHRDEGGKGRAGLAGLHQGGHSVAGDGWAQAPDVGGVQFNISSLDRSVAVAKAVDIERAPERDLQPTTLGPRASRRVPYRKGNVRPLGRHDVR